MLTTPPRPGRKILETQFFSDAAVLRSEYGLLRLQAFDRGILRVTFTRSGAFPEASPFLVKRTSAPVRDTAEDAEFVYVSTSSLRARVSKATGVLETFDAEGKPVFAEGGLRTLDAFDAKIIDRSRPAFTEKGGGKNRLQAALPRAPSPLFPG